MWATPHKPIVNYFPITFYPVFTDWIIRLIMQLRTKVEYDDEIWILNYVVTFERQIKGKSWINMRKNITSEANSFSQVHCMIQLSSVRYINMLSWPWFWLERKRFEWWLRFELLGQKHYAPKTAQLTLCFNMEQVTPFRLVRKIVGTCGRRHVFGDRDRVLWHWCRPN